MRKSNVRTVTAEQVRRTRLLRLVVLAVVGLVLGGLAGTVLSHSRQSYVTNAQVIVTPDPQLLATDSDADSDQQQLFVQNEIITLNSDAFYNQVAARLGNDNFDLDSNQIEITDGIQISATSPAKKNAIAAAAAAVTLYTNQRSNELANRISQAEQLTQSELASTRAQLRSQAGSGSAVGSSLQSTYSNLLAQENQLSLDARSASDGVDVVQRASADSTVRSGSGTSMAVLGALVGAFVLLVLEFAIRRTRSRLGSVDAVLELSGRDSVLVVPRRELANASTGPGEATERHIRTLATKLIGGGPAVHGLVIVPIDGVVANGLAVNIAAEAARRRQIVLVSEHSETVQTALAVDTVSLNTTSREPARINSQPSRPGWDGSVRTESGTQNGFGAAHSDPEEVPDAVRDLSLGRQLSVTKHLGLDVRWVSDADPTQVSWWAVVDHELEDMAARGRAIVVNGPDYGESAVGVDAARSLGRAVVVVSRGTRRSDLSGLLAALDEEGVDVAELVVATGVGRS
jgi:hypothetical protein